MSLATQLHEWLEWMESCDEGNDELPLLRRALTVIEAVEKLPKPELHWLREVDHKGDQVAMYADPKLAEATKQLKEMIK